MLHCKIFDVTYRSIKEISNNSSIPTVQNCKYKITANGQGMSNGFLLSLEAV